MPSSTTHEVLTKGSPKKHHSERKCDTEKRRCDDKQRTRRKSKSPEKKHVSKEKECKKHIIEKIIFTVSTTGVLVPSGATHMKISMLGGGGGGGKFKSILSENLHGGGGGGAGGAYIKEGFPVKPGKSFNVRIGAGGKGGDDVEGNGRNGCDTKLVYECHTKVAYGGQGGLYNLNGGFGGKGGCGTGRDKDGRRGKDGHSGKDGCIGGRGGRGGEADNKNCEVYGNGGMGGSDPNLTPVLPLPPLPPCSPCHPRHEQKESAPLVLVGPNGADGVNGYCEVVFYREGPACDVPYCVNPIQEIVACDRDTTHWVNPDSQLVIVDTSNAVANLSLGRPMARIHRIVIKMLHQNGMPVYITTSSGGTFALSANNPSVTLFFADCVWDVEDNFQDVHSFYPTTQQGPTQALEGFIPNIGVFGGSRVDISADGNTAVIGAWTDNASVGAAWIYVRRHKCWERQAKLVGTGAVGASEQGRAVALSADGNTLAVGGPADNAGRGAVWIFVRDGCKWTQQGAKLVATDVNIQLQGASVNLSADGNTLAVGAPLSTLPANGAALIYNRVGCTWTLVATLVDVTVLTNTAAIATGQGSNVRLNADGDVLAVGGRGAVSIWNLVLGVWVYYTTIEGPITFSRFGIVGMDLSADGRTLAVGDTLATPTAATYIYVNQGGVWVQQGIPLVGVPLVNSTQGAAVALSADGNTLAVGDRNAGVTSQGGVFIFTRTSGTWTQREFLVGPPAQTNLFQGDSVALSSEANTLIVGHSQTITAPFFWVWT